MGNCKCKDDKYPRLFKTQTETEVDFSDVTSNSLSLQVLLKQQDVEVKLDLTSEMSLTDPVNQPQGTTFVEFDYILQRSTNNGPFSNLSTVTARQRVNIFEGFNNPDRASLIPNHTWTDKTGIGLHVYRVFIDNSTVVAGAAIFDSLMFQTRSLNATVFCT
ncbi:hypothetical protein [Cytobacillus sp. IB215665]|uniref:hypothetical protein n=1 Tax=Cytobacillus sp. IB215665 TaxID=3097357 RepID=UPI002A177693|nr:hypothetical protein [Cytobacillus sp. IB215665]MDX8367736.1 hypothetical protein [Cytobacillus sp. IB215665]